jgi:hypothetical protein
LLGIHYFFYRPAGAGPLTARAPFAVFLVYGVVYGIIDENGSVPAFQFAGSACHACLGIDLKTEFKFFGFCGHWNLSLLLFIIFILSTTD